MPGRFHISFIFLVSFHVEFNTMFSQNKSLMPKLVNQTGLTEYFKGERRPCFHVFRSNFCTEANLQMSAGPKTRFLRVIFAPWTGLTYILIPQPHLKRPPASLPPSGLVCQIHELRASWSRILLWGTHSP